MANEIYCFYEQTSFDPTGIGIALQVQLKKPTKQTKPFTDDISAVAQNVAENCIKIIIMS